MIKYFTISTKIWLYIHWPDESEDFKEVLKE